MRNLLVAILLVTACVRSVAPAPLVLVRYDAPSIYQTWYREAFDCATHVARTVDISVDSSIVFADLKFFAVPTEAPRGTFDLAAGPVYGATVHGAVLLSGQHLNNRVVVKHELMHIFVTSPGEDVLGAHGAPWGLCEWL